MLSKLRHFVPSSVLVNIYNITLYLTYGLISWRNACKTYLDKILILQKSAIRLYILQTDKIMLFRPFFVNSKVLPINFLYYQSLLNLMQVDKRNTPINILNLFSRTSNSHHYSTRSSTSQNFYIKKSRLDIQKNAFSHVGAKIWNEILNSFKNISRRTFRKKLKGALSNILKTEDNYIENDKIMARLQKT